MCSTYLKEKSSWVWYTFERISNFIVPITSSSWINCFQPKISYLGMGRERKTRSILPWVWNWHKEWNHCHVSQESIAQTVSAFSHRQHFLPSLQCLLFPRQLGGCNTQPASKYGWLSFWHRNPGRGLIAKQREKKMSKYVVKGFRSIFSRGKIPSQKI